MSDTMATGIVTVALAVVSVATLAVIFAPKSTTAKVIGAGAAGLGYDIMAAVSPVTGQSPQPLSASSFN